MKHYIRKTIIGAFAGMLALTGLAGCGSSLNESEVVAEIGDVEITLGVANFCARYNQMYYDSYYFEYFGDDMWEQDVEEGTTYEKSIKESILEDLKQMYVLDAVKDDYGVSITAEDEEEIKKAAQQFIADNGDDAVTVMSASEAVVTEFLRLYTVSERVTAEIISEADTNVTDDEAAQKKMVYVALTEATGEEEDITIVKNPQTDSQTIQERVKAGEDITEVAEELGYTASPYTFDSETTYPTEAVAAAADALSEGDVTEVVDEETYYVVWLESEFDEEATEAKKETIISERQNELFTEVYEKLAEDFEFKLYSKVWDKVSFVKQGVTYKEEAADNTDNTSDTTDGSSDNTDDTSDTTDGSSDNTDNSSDDADSTDGSADEDE